MSHSPPHSPSRPQPPSSYHKFSSTIFGNMRFNICGILAAWLILALFWFAMRSYTAIYPFDQSSLVHAPEAPSLQSPTVETAPTSTFYADDGHKPDRPLVTYVYSESAEARQNLQFFITHGLHSQADFLFIFNGETDAYNLVPVDSGIRFVRRNNTCYDLGSHAEVLSTDDLWRRYTRFILMNASVRGPFMPSWAEGSCWTERLLAKVTEEVKLVGVSLNCWPTPHVQSMVWATDAEGLALLLHPPSSSPRHDEWMEILFSHAEDFPRPSDYAPSDPDWVEQGLSQCFANRQDAVQAEIAATGIILGAGKRVDTLLTKYQTSLEHDALAFCEPLGAWDPQSDGSYDGASIHPFETIFIKTNRGIDPKTIDNLTKWTDLIGYSSYDQCMPRRT